VANFVKIDVEDDNIIIPKGAIIINSIDDLTFETAHEYRFRKEENNEN